MDWRDTPEQAEWRKEVRSFLKTELPDFGELDRYSRPGAGEMKAAWDKWRSALASRGWIASAWPKEYGGAGLSPIDQFILNEEFAEARAPQMGGMGVMMLGPTIITHGNDDQKKTHIPRILDGSVQWCQGYSEPGSGSDLASLQTRAIRDGDDFVVNGQKIWTSGAHNADWCFMLARTDPDAPKHRGITYLLLDMKSPGITVRPLVNMADQHHFNEVFFEDVRVPAANAVGEVNRGWYIGTTTLDFERSSIGSAVGQRQNVERNIRWLKENKASIAPTDYDAARLQWADRWVEVQTATLLSYRIISMQASGKIPNSEASIAKGFNTELTQRISRTALKMMGMMGQVTDRKAPMKGNVAVGYLGSVSATIAGGTSEIQRNIIATRGLGLPRA
ncbi:MAG TPA: acyl-CoA dehydrogenase family protein [Tepidiformaceae bacterium]|jgi:alkylation response protein AidB-like acyl-CoA dehydrogenase|nr:acyl-CoA dehydrogenase family protein [Thermoflexaceae bacterium]HMS60120.1 acyl-CoA dehydrogenase family protein [Tepidiformaceae bacterium]